MSASLTLNVDLNSQRVPSVRVYSDSMIEHTEMRQSRFSPDAQPRPAMPSRISTKDAGTGLLATQLANKHVSLNQDSRVVCKG